MFLSVCLAPFSFTATHAQKYIGRRLPSLHFDTMRVVSVVQEALKVHNPVQGAINPDPDIDTGPSVLGWLRQEVTSLKTRAHTYIRALAKE